MKNLPITIKTPVREGGHIQGIAYDPVGGHIYCSFTTELLKLDLEGNLVGSVGSLVGHLGCIALDEKTRRIYGSLELKHDSIGQGIINRIGASLAAEDSFYIASFDIDKIDRVGMNAETDSVMNATYLADVVRDYSDIDTASGRAHHLGCSGIDGVTFCPSFDGTNERRITVAYGIYSETDRTDNDYQVLLQYDPEELDRFARPLRQTEPHHSGASLCAERFFFYTGNTSWGIQNLEYDAENDLLFCAVYRGKKETFTPFRLFAADLSAVATPENLKGRNGERGRVLKSAQIGVEGLCGIRGSHFLHGSTGLASLGNGYFYISEPENSKQTLSDGTVRRSYSSTICLYKLDTTSPDVFVKC